MAHRADVESGVLIGDNIRQMQRYDCDEITEARARARARGEDAFKGRHFFFFVIHINGFNYGVNCHRLFSVLCARETRDVTREGTRTAKTK